MYTRIFRFAPSPNGYLHLGHAYSALLNYDMARACDGQLLLRIENIDATRCRPEYETAIYEDLRWLGVSWTEPVRRQSEHFADYRAAVAKLEAAGLWYPSFESRSEIAAMVAERERAGPWPRDPDGVPLYPGVARSMMPKERARLRRAGQPFALRLDTAAAAPRAGRGAALGRRCIGTQGVADELSSCRGRGRCLAGRHRRGARAGPVLGDRHSSIAAGAARAAGAGLSPSSADLG